MSRWTCWPLTDVWGNSNKLSLLVRYGVGLNPQQWPPHTTLVFQGHWLDPHRTGTEPLTKSERHVVQTLARWCAAHPEQCVVIFGSREYERWYFTHDDDLDALLRLSHLVYVWRQTYVFSYGTLRNRWCQEFLKEPPGLVQRLLARMGGSSSGNSSRVSLEYTAGLLNERWREQPDSAHGHLTDANSPLLSTVGQLAPDAWYEEDFTPLRYRLVPYAEGPVFCLAGQPSQYIEKYQLGARWWPPRGRHGKASGYLYWYREASMTLRPSGTFPVLVATYPGRLQRRTQYLLLRFTRTTESSATEVSREPEVVAVRFSGKS